MGYLRYLGMLTLWPPVAIVQEAGKWIYDYRTMKPAVRHVNGWRKKVVVVGPKKITWVLSVLTVKPSGTP